MEFRAIKGMNDILPDEARRFALVESVFRRVVELHGFSEVRTPVLEPTELFVRSTGETSEIVEKQMFTLQRESESFTLRPEGTPGVARAFLRKEVAGNNPWGASATTLEWTLSSPPPFHQFESLPLIK